MGKLSSVVWSLAVEIVGTHVPWVAVLVLTRALACNSLSVLDLVSLWSILLVIVDHQDGLVILVELFAVALVGDVHNLLFDIFDVVFVVIIDAVFVVVLLVFALVVIVFLFFTVVLHLNEMAINLTVVVHLVASLVFIIVHGESVAVVIFGLALLFDDILDFLVNLALDFVVVVVLEVV